MLMAEGLDEGDILEIYKEQIQPNDTNLSLRERLVKKSASVIGDVLQRWIDGEITPQKQDSSKATYCWQKDISKENAEIKWEVMEPEYIERLVRAMIPWPIAWTTVNIQGNTKIMKIFESELLEILSDNTPGTLYSENNQLLFSTKNPNLSLRVKDLQIEGKARTKERDFLNGLGRELI